MNHSSASQEPEEVALLTGPRAASVLSAALAPAGQRLASWEVHSVHHRPGAGVSVGYTAVVVAPNGRSTTEYLCATTARLSNPHAPGLTRVAPTGGDGPAVHVWRHPADPELPGLVVACTPSLLSARIGTQVKATMVAYRPTRRAVVRATFLPQPPSAMALGASGDAARAEAVGAAVARGLKSLGINWNFAPVLDVNNNPANPVIGERSFSNDPVEVSRLAAAWMRGSLAECVACCVKHFPGHGDTHVDSHHALPTVDKSRAELNALELVPFKALASQAPAMMTAHIVYPQIDPDRPATLSPQLIGGILR
uniref:glycoside hydrolase family 3 N-terminal domain-containing protein n=1 Tax=uncultured Actinomyces sp. TaxID=249061 RepID=UPI0028062059